MVNFSNNIQLTYTSLLNINNLNIFILNQFFNKQFRDKLNNQSFNGHLNDNNNQNFLNNILSENNVFPLFYNPFYINYLLATLGSSTNN